MGNVLSVITDQKLLNIQRGTPVFEFRFDNDDGEIYPFIPTSQITQAKNIDHALFIENASGIHDQGVTLTFTDLQPGDYVLNFEITDNRLNGMFAVNMTNTSIEHRLIEEGTTGLLSYPFTVTSTGNYTLSFLTYENAQGTFILDNIEILDVTGLNPEEVANNSQEMPIFVPSVLSFSDYYPFGMMMPGRHAKSDAYRYGFGGHENIDEIHNVTGSTIDMGDRWLDTRLGRTLKLDYEKKMYPGVSPYAYAMNTPLQAVDPDGKVIIFINGLWGPLGDIDYPKEKYWGNNWISSLKKHWKDNKALFFDGSFGGQKYLQVNIYPEVRQAAGREAGHYYAKSIIKNLSAGETIKFVTNSMGAAYQRGFSEGLYQYITEQQTSDLFAIMGVEANISDIENQMKNIESTPLVKNVLAYENLQKELATQKQKLSELKADLTKLNNIKTEIVVDIEPQDATDRDPHAQKHYYILSDKSDYNTAEELMLNIQPVTGATDASTKSNGDPVTKGHHSSFVTPTDLPKP